MVLWPQNGRTYYAVIDYWEKHYVMRVIVKRAGLRWVDVLTDECGIHEEERVRSRDLHKSERAAARACERLNYRARRAER